MAKKIFIILILLISTASYGKNNKITLVVMDFLPLENISKAESMLFSEIIRSELIKSEFIKIIESSQKDKIENELKFQKSGLVEGSILDLGKKLKTEYFLTGSVSLINKKVILTSRIISAKTGLNIYANNIYMKQESALIDIYDFLDQIVSTILTATLGNNIENIERSVERGEALVSHRRMKIYLKNHKSTAKTEELIKKINKQLFDLYKQEYEQSIVLNDFKKAYLMTKKMVKIAPDNKSLLEIYQNISEDYKKYLIISYDDFLLKINGLIKKQKYVKAKKTMDNFYFTEGFSRIDDQFFELYKVIILKLKQQSLSTTDNLLEIPLFLRFQDISETSFINYITRLTRAKKKALSSLENNGDCETCSRQLVNINKNIEIVQTAYNPVNEEVKFLDKGNRSHHNFAVSGNLYGDFFDSDYPISVKNSYLGFGLNYSFHSEIDESFSALLNVGINYNSGNETVIDGIYNYTNSFNYGYIWSSIDFGYSWSSLGLYVGPLVNIGVMYRESVYTQGSTGNELPTVLSLAVGLGVDIHANWHFGESGVYLFSSVQLVPTIFTGELNRMVFANSLGIGYEF